MRTVELSLGISIRAQRHDVGEDVEEAPYLFLQRC